MFYALCWNEAIFLLTDYDLASQSSYFYSLPQLYGVADQLDISDVAAALHITLIL